MAISPSEPLPILKVEGRTDHAANDQAKEINFFTPQLMVPPPKPTAAMTQTDLSELGEDESVVLKTNRSSSNECHAKRSVVKRGTSF